MRRSIVLSKARPRVGKTSESGEEDSDGEPEMLTSKHTKSTSVSEEEFEDDRGDEAGEEDGEENEIEYDNGEESGGYDSAEEEKIKREVSRSRCQQVAVNNRSTNINCSKRWAPNLENPCAR